MTNVNLNGFTTAVYPSLANFPISAPDGSLAVALDTDILYEFDGDENTWIVIGPGGGGGGGTVTSVSLTVPSIFNVSGSPITTSGTLAVTLATAPANTILSGPTTGGPGTPTFRAIVAADLSAVPLYKVNEFLLSPTDITNKFVTLTSAPLNPTLTILEVIGGPVQQYTTDFTVSGSTLSWSGLFLDGVLIAGDTITIQFY